MKNRRDDSCNPNTLIILDAPQTQASPGMAAKAQAPEGLTTDPLLGTVFDGKYRIEKRLGVGGMGVVYRANHIFIDRPVAIKLLRANFLSEAAAVERFKIEAGAAGRIQHA